MRRSSVKAASAGRCGVDRHPAVERGSARRGQPVGRRRIRPWPRLRDPRAHPSNDKRRADWRRSISGRDARRNSHWRDTVADRQRRRGCRRPRRATRFPGWVAERTAAGGRLAKNSDRGRPTVSLPLRRHGPRYPETRETMRRRGNRNQVLLVLRHRRRRAPRRAPPVRAAPAIRSAQASGSGTAVSVTTPPVWVV